MGKLIHQSVSCVITINNHVLLAKRSSKLRHFPGYWSLAGGKVETSDKNSLHTLRRELLEELGLETYNLEFLYLGECLTPEFAPYRFENKVYHLHLDQLDPGRIELTLNDEHEKYLWLEKEKLDIFFADSSVLSVPMLKWFIGKALRNEIGDFNNDYLDDKKELLKASYVTGIQTYIVPSRSLPPAKHTNVLAIDNWLVDPSPRKKEHIDILVKQWREASINSIFISHWHLDHHENVRHIALELNADIYLSQKTREIIETRWGEDYFKDLNVFTLDPDQMIETISGKKLRVLNNEGHALGQLGLEEEHGNWCFVSDVFQGVGSVVVEEMSLYMKCLLGLIGKGAQTIFIPSHGLPIGSNHVLSNIYEHRLKREAQIAALLGDGQDRLQILETLYPSLKKELHKHALKNIDGHIQRILSLKKS